MKPVRVAFVSRVRLNPYVRLLARGVHAVAPEVHISHSYFLSLLWVLKHARRQDLLHIHWIEHLYLVPRAWQRRKGFISVALGLLLARLLGVKIVYTVHNINHHEGRSPILNRLANHLIFRLAHAVHVHDASVAGEIRHLYGRSRGVFVIPHGSYLGAYPDDVNRQEARAALRAKEIPIPDDVFLFLFLGQVRPYKGLEFLIQAFRELEAPHARLLIVGKAEAPAYADRIRELARDDPRIITHMTYVSDEELQYFFRAADVCVFPYRHITTSGAALLAFTFERPIIAPAMGPFVELAAEGRGLLYPPGSLEGLRGALQSALAGALRGAEEPVRVYARSHDWPSLARHHVRIYERLLKQRILPEVSSLPPIVCAGRDPWGGPWRNRHQIFSRLAAKVPVLYVEPRPYVRQVLRRPLGLSWWPRLQSPLPLSPDLYVLSLPAWAARSGRRIGRRLGDALARRLIARAMRRALDGFPAQRYTESPLPILWLTAPDQVDFLDLVPARAVVYHIVDDYTAYEAEHLPPERLQDIRARHEALIRRADLVICTHPSLAEEARRLNANVHLVPNAVDLHLFHRARTVPAMPEDLAAVPRPRVGYVGVLNDKIDIALLRSLIERLPHIHLVLVGPEALRHHRDERQLLDHPRIHAFGFRDPRELPFYMKGLDVALMPYRLNPWTARIDPLKLYEYFALGLPVVSTPIPAVDRVRDLLYVGAGEDFATAVEVALVEEDENLRLRREAFAEANTWEMRVMQIERLLVSLCGLSPDHGEPVDGRKDEEQTVDAVQRAPVPRNKSA